MAHQTNEVIQLLTPLQEGVLILKRRFPGWDEVQQLSDDVAAVERRLARVSPRLLNLVGKGASMKIEEEDAVIAHTLAQKYGK